MCENYVAVLLIVDKFLKVCLFCFFEKAQPLFIAIDITCFDDFFSDRFTTLTSIVIIVTTSSCILSLYQL